MRDPQREAEQQIHDVLYGNAAPWPLTVDQRQLLTAMRFHIGRQRAIPLHQLCGNLKLGEREAKNLMRSLVVDFKVRIGAARTQPYGYYLITTAEEAHEAAAVYWSEAFELIRRARVLEDKHKVLEMLGQIRAEFEQEKSA